MDDCVTVSPAAPTAGATALVTVDGAAACAGINVDFGDGNVEFFSNGSGPPMTHPHAWATAGTVTITAQGLGGGCNGQATSSSITVVVGTPPPSTVLGVSVSPSPVNAGQWATITVTGTNPCTSLWMDYGDGHWGIVSISGLPHTITRYWSAPGTYTVLARGVYGCGGEVTTTLPVTDGGPIATVTGVGASPNPVVLGQPATSSSTFACPPRRPGRDARDEPDPLRHQRGRRRAVAVGETADEGGLTGLPGSR